MAKQSIIKGILIDVHNLEVKEIEFEDSLERIYRILRCDIITTAPCPYEGHDIVADDEALLKPLQNFFTFNIDNIERSLCGNGLIVSYDEEGNWNDHKLNVDEVRASVHFLKYIRINGEIVALEL